MRITCLFTCFALLAHGYTVGAEKNTPYEAIVDVDDGENVWSGPDTKKHYPTSRLNKGDHVKVIRHDPGGWCMIEPPEGSFSWVRNEYVQKDGPTRGSIIENNVKVHVGSEVKPDRFLTYQAELSRGSAVEILGEKVFQFDETPRLMLKIKPVKREWRWIKRRSIVAADSIKADPFDNERSTPKRKNGPVAEGDSDANAWPVSVGTTLDDEQDESAPVTASKTREQNLPPGKQRLAEIDREFHDMIQNEPPTWNLDSLEDAYKQLDEDIGTASMSAQIARRLETVKRYRKTFNEYNDFLKLTSETKQRDALLLSQQSQFQSQLGNPPVSKPITPTPTPINPNPTPSSNQPTLNNPQQTPSSQLQPQSQPQAGAAPQGGTPSFDGAGIVRKLAKSFPGGPQYILVAPDERFLTFLMPGPGVDLNRYNGRPVGIMGQRQRREDWNADILTVRTLQPVQLRGMK